MKLKLVEAMELFSGLQQLDTYDKIVRVNGADQLAREPYSWSVDTRIAISINIQRVRSLVMVHQDAADGLRKQFVNGGEQVPANRMEEYREETRRLAHSIEDVKLRMISVGDLRLESNPIPPTVLAMIAPVIKGMPPDAPDASDEV